MNGYQAIGVAQLNAKANSPSLGGCGLQTDQSGQHWLAWCNLDAVWGPYKLRRDNGGVILVLDHDFHSIVEGRAKSTAISHFNHNGKGARCQTVAID
jgi:transposase